MSANWNTAWGQWIIEELVRLGTPVFCVAPGSRSTPLTTAVAAHPGATSRVFTDERSAAFFALGVGRATGRPAVIITTSGTAAAHAYPAIIEANQSGVPLLLLSANRPPELHDTGANQTIDQHHLFGDRVRWHRALPCPSPEFPATALLSVVNQAWLHTVSGHPGPVHLDLPFREPLGPAQPAPLPEDPRLGVWERTGTPWARSGPARHRPEIGDTEDLARLLDTTHRGVLLVGTLDDPRERAAARKLANRLGWPTLADITSGLRLDESLTHALECTDALFGSPRIRSLARPQVVLQLGGPLVSRRIVQAWTESPPDTWVTVGPEARRQDPTGRVTWRIQAHVSELEAGLEDSGLPVRPRELDRTWVETLVRAGQAAHDDLRTRITGRPDLTEPSVARIVSEEVPDGSPLFVASSMPVRDLQNFGARRTHPPRVAANRGASGIDGTVACAAGYGAGLGQRATVLLGDQALLHDLSSIPALAQLPQPPVLVVVNNGGGGIFSLLPIASSGVLEPSQFETLFAAGHTWSFGPLAESFGLVHQTPSSPGSLRDALHRAHTGDQPTLIEVRTSRVENAAWHQSLIKGATAAAEASLEETP